jgi:hypothetical protein
MVKLFKRNYRYFNLASDTLAKKRSIANRYNDFGSIVEKR